MAILAGAWLSAARTYLVLIGLGSLLWEAMQFPLYTIWTEGNRGHIVLALVHGTVSDLFIAAAMLMVSLVAFGDRNWRLRRFWRVGLSAIVLGVVYTAYSEWMNVEVRHTWAYSGLMPRLPLPDIGLAPLLQWIIVPAAALLITRRYALGPIGT